MTPFVTFHSGVSTRIKVYHFVQPNRGGGTSSNLGGGGGGGAHYRIFINNALSEAFSSTGAFQARNTMTSFQLI